MGERCRGRRCGRRHVWLAGLLGGLIAMAVWGKLRFVSNVPRMAYADPAERQPARDGHGEANRPDGLDRSGGRAP
jgi:hypothetical protein